MDKFWSLLLDNPLCLKLRRLPLFAKMLTKEFVLYVIFGVLTTVVSMVTLKLFEFVFAVIGWQGLLHFILRSKDYAYLDANILSWIFSVAFAFVTNKVFVFESKSWAPKVALRELGPFIGARLFSLLVDEVLMFVFVSLLDMKSMLAKLIVILNYVLSKVFVFKKKTLQTEKDVI